MWLNPTLNDKEASPKHFWQSGIAESKTAHEGSQSFSSIQEHWHSWLGNMSRRWGYFQIMVKIPYMPKSEKYYILSEICGKSARPGMGCWFHSHQGPAPVDGDGCLDHWVRPMPRPIPDQWEKMAWFIKSDLWAGRRHCTICPTV